MAIKWTPWFSAPMHRRLELLGVMFYFFTITSGIIASIVILYLLYAGSVFWKTICVLYLAFIYYDRNTSDRGGRGVGVAWVRGLSIWKHCINYFPIDLIKTVDLTPDRNYLFCIFPHGTLSIGAAATFASHSKWSTLFPGIRPKLTTLRANTLVPIQREFVLSTGVSAATENSLTTLLSQANDDSTGDGYTANGVGLVCGGMRESRVPIPNCYKCVIAKRRGFARIALKTGASLVPVISFGETNAYVLEQFKSWSWGPQLVAWMDKHLGFPGILNGRGIFQYNFGILPRRHPINVVVGAPIHLQKTANPTQTELDTVHERFCTQLKQLFETHKAQFYEHPENVTMELI